MKVYIDTDNKKLVRSDTDSTSPGKLTFVAGDAEPIELILLTRGSESLFEPIAIASGDTVCAAIARFKGEPKVLSISGDVEMSTSGKASIVLPLNTKEIYEALSEATSLSGAYFEVQISYANGNVSTVYQEQCILKGDLIRDVPDVHIQERFCTVAELNNVLDATSRFNGIKVAVRNESGSLTSENIYLVFEKDANGQITPAYLTESEYHEIS